jgi:hypothetical protein
MRSPLGTRYFAHVERDPACVAGYESKEHLLLKEVALKTAHELGFDAEDEAWRGPAVPDVLIVDPNTKRQIAVEIQLSRQTGYETRTRTNARAGLGMDTIWFLGKRRDYDDVPKTQRQVLPLLLPEGPVDTVQSSFVRKELTAYLTGATRFDDFSDLATVPCLLVGYDFPCGSCMTSWYRTSVVALYPNRIRRDFSPLAIPISTLGNPGATLAAFEQKSGKAVGRLVDGKLICPVCGALPEAEFITGEAAVLMPSPDTTGKYDARWLPGSIGRDESWRPPPPPQFEERTTEYSWTMFISENLDRIRRDRRGREDAEERRRLEEAHRRREAERETEVRNAVAAEVGQVRRAFSPHLSDEVIAAWLAAHLPALGHRTPDMIIREHVRSIDSLPGRPSPALELAWRMINPNDRLKGVGCGFSPRDIRWLRKSIAAARRRTDPSSNPGVMRRAWIAMFG